MRTQACVVRVENARTPGWHGLAAAFDDITFIRDEPFPSAVNQPPNRQTLLVCYDERVC